LKLCAVENVAYKKSRSVNSFRRSSQSKRHVDYDAWTPATPPRDVTSGDHVTDCVQLNSRYVDRPTMRVDLGRRMDVSGVIVTGQKTIDGMSWNCGFQQESLSKSTFCPALVYYMITVVAEYI